ncbi:MAG: hypothetical protein ABL914_05530 [Novosphingobium sp.]|uniref:hypothetical protein n=1 Tax=Novosphingobium sp. TaxID=1874826 RepID=UPI0032BE7C06
MLARLPRPFAVLIALLFAAALGWCLAAPEQALVKAAAGNYTDMQLYRDITAQMDRGAGYYAAATSQQRLHEYPTKPFVTVRLPTLYWLASKIGWGNLGSIEIALLLANALVWPLAMPQPLRRAERIGAGIAIFLGGLACASPALTPMSEIWCGLLVSLAAALRLWRKGSWWLPLACIAAALTIRELAFGFVILAAALAIFEGKRREVVAWLVLTVLFAGGLLIHAMAVAPHVQPGDLSSPGWSSGLGLRGLLQALVGTTLLQQLPRAPAMALALLPMLGWLALEWRSGKFALLCLAGYGLAIALFPRPDNFYWGFLLLPMWFAGLALVPRGLWQLGGAIRNR